MAGPRGRCQTLVVALERRRELPEERPELPGVRQRLDALEEALEVDGRIAEALDVGQVAAHLHGEGEVSGVSIGPARNSIAAREPVERRVHLDGVVSPGVEPEPPARGKAAGIEGPAAPARVVPTRAADADAVRCQRGHSRRRVRFHESSRRNTRALGCRLAMRSAAHSPMPSSGGERCRGRRAVKRASDGFFTRSCCAW